VSRLGVLKRSSRASPPRLAGWGWWALPVAALPLLVVLIQGLGLPLLLGGLLLIASMAPLLLWPRVATLVVVFLLYANIPGVVLINLGVPRPVAGAFILLLLIPLGHQVLVLRRPLRVDVIVLLMLGFLSVMLLGTLGAVNQPVALEAIQKFLVEGLLLYWLFLNVVRDWVDLRRVVWTVLAAGTLLGSMNIYQAATGSYDQQFLGLAERKLHYEHKREAAAFTVVEEPKLYSAMRAGGPGLGSNRFAQIMIVLLPLAFVALRTSRRGSARMAAAAALGLILVGGVILTYSRATFLVLVVLLLLAGAVGWIRRSHLIMVAILALVLVPVVNPVFVHRIATLGALTELDDPSTADGSLRGRATEMLAALHAYRDHPILGLGPGQYHRVHSVTYQQIPEIKFRDLQVTRRAHMLYFELAADTGTVGLAFFLAIPMVLLRGLWVERARWAGSDPERAAMATGLFLSIIAFLGTAVFLSHAYERYYWFLIAMASIALHLLREEREPTLAAAPPLGRGASPDPDWTPLILPPARLKEGGR
jgi:putative inorganic carbon (hco3(-)) transporter